MKPEELRPLRSRKRGRAKIQRRAFTRLTPALEELLRTYPDPRRLAECKPGMYLRDLGDGRFEVFMETRSGETVTVGTLTRDQLLERTDSTF